MNVNVKDEDVQLTKLIHILLDRNLLIMCVRLPANMSTGHIVSWDGLCSSQFVVKTM